MAHSDSARRRFLAALGLYLVWVGVLAAMAVSTARKPPARLIPPAAEEAADERPPGP